LGLDIGFRRDRPHFAGLHPERVQKLPHLRRPALNARQGSNLGLGFGDCGGGMGDQVRFQGAAIFVEGTLPRRDADRFELRQPACTVLLEVAIIGRFGNRTEPLDLLTRQPLAFQIEHFHF
jgi:hypothetical protein